MTVRRILVGLDGSALAETILGTVRVLAGRLGAEVVLLHVTHVPESFRAAADATLDGVVERERRDAESYLRRLARELTDDGFIARTAVAIGEPAAGSCASPTASRSMSWRSRRTGARACNAGCTAASPMPCSTPPLGRCCSSGRPPRRRLRRSPTSGA